MRSIGVGSAAPRQQPGAPEGSAKHNCCLFWPCNTDSKISHVGTTCNQPVSPEHSHKQIVCEDCFWNTEYNL